MRGDCLGVNGLNPDVRTPHMDALAARGVNLPRHFTIFPKCVPARVSLATGRYPHTGGFRTINQHLPADRPNLLKTLLEAGYASAVFGLNHCWEHLFEASQTPPELGPGQRGLRVDHHSWTAGYRAIYADCKARMQPPAGSGKRADLDRPLTPEVAYDGAADLHWDSEALTRQAVHFLTGSDAAAGGDGAWDGTRPFFMQVNWSPPHPPYAAPEPWYSMFDPDRIQVFPHRLPDDAPLALREQREHRTGIDADDGLLRRMQAVYYGMIARVDEQVGRVLAALDARGVAEHTVVLLISDHGDFAGQYGLGEKWDTTFADCLTHVPCVVAGPGLEPGRGYDGLSDHTDLAPTLLGLLGLPVGWDVHGHDLGPALRGEAAEEARHEVFAEGGHEAAMRARVSRDIPENESGKQRTYRLAPDSMARARMVRTADHKLVIRETGDHELYDLAADRWELHNRYADPALAGPRAALMERLLRWCLTTDPDEPHQERVHA